MKEEEKSLSKDLLLLVLDLQSKLESEDPGLSLFQTLSFLSHLRGLLKILRESNQDQEVKNQEISGERSTVYQIHKLLIQIGSELEYSEERNSIQLCSHSLIKN